MIVAFMGNDGSGKTTLSKKFKVELIKLGINVQYKEEFDYFLIKRFFKLLDTKKLSKIRNSFIKLNEKQKPVYFMIWPYLVWFDLFLEWIWIKLFKRNKIVVMDRYAYDFLMSWEWLGYNNRSIRWLFSHFPRPDLAFILDVLAETAYLRKRSDHFYAIDFYKIQRKRYLNFANSLSIRIINTEKSVESSLKDVTVEFRKYLINKLSVEDKVLLFYSFPSFNMSILQELDQKFDWFSLNWSYLTDIAIKCNVENALCKNLLLHHENQFPRKISALLKYILNRSENRVQLLVSTLKVLSKNLSYWKIPFLVMKTIAPFDYGATDIDVLVRKEDFERARKILSAKFKESESSRIGTAITYRNNLLTVDLHFEVSWLHHKVVDEKEVFARRRKVKYKDVEILIPSPEDEFLILAAHSLFQHHYTTLGDFLQIVQLSEKNQINKEYILTSADRYKWKVHLESLISHLRWKNFILYCDSFLENLKCKNIMNLRISPIYFHGFSMISKKNLLQILDLLLTFYRRVLFMINQRLPYNENWLCFE